MDTTPFVVNENGTPVTCYVITFDGRKMTVHGPDGPRTRTRRNCRVSATLAMVHAMGYTDFSAMCPPGTDDVITFARLALDPNRSHTRPNTRVVIERTNPR